MMVPVHLATGLNAFADQLQAEITHAGADWLLHENAVHFCIALGFRSAYQLPPGGIFFEKPGPSGRTDLWMAPLLDLAIEAKFWRGIPSGKNNPYPQHFGDLLADLNKVARFKSTSRLAILVTDERGYEYLEGNGCGLVPLSPGLEKTVRREDLDTLKSQVTAVGRALKFGPWKALTVELSWEKLRGPWRLLAWKVTPKP